MSVGLGIFLSTLVMALLFLYAITRDRWKWERGVRLVFLGSVAIASLAGIGIASVYIWTLGSNIWKRSFPIVQTEYWGLRLGMSMEEVQHVKGIPNVVYELDVFGKAFIFKEDFGEKLVKKSKNVEDFSEWAYWPPRSVRFDIEFDEKRSLRSVLCYWSEFDDPLQCPAIEGVKIGYSRDQIIRTLGEPSRSGPSMDAERLAYSNGAVFWLRKNKYGVYDGNKGFEIQT